MNDHDASHVTATAGANLDGDPSFSITVDRSQGADLWRALDGAKGSEVAAVAADKLKAAIATVFGEEQTTALLQPAAEVKR